MKYLYLILIVILVTACSQSAAISTEKTVPSAAEIEYLAKGKNAFEDNCDGCHKLKDPAKISEEKLTSIVPKMAVKAKVDEETGKAILNYMLSVHRTAANATSAQ